MFQKLVCNVISARLGAVAVLWPVRFMQGESIANCKLFPVLRHDDLQHAGSCNRSVTF